MRKGTNMYMLLMMLVLWCQTGIEYTYLFVWDCIVKGMVPEVDKYIWYGISGCSIGFQILNTYLNGLFQRRVIYTPSLRRRKMNKDNWIKRISKANYSASTDDAEDLSAAEEGKSENLQDVRPITQSGPAHLGTDVQKGIFHGILLKAVPGNMKEQLEAICDMREFEKLYNWRIAPQQLPVLKIEITVAPLTEVERFEPILDIMKKIADGNAPRPQITMRYELLRICTLRNYPKDNKPYLTHLAAAGFYYAAEGDEVICYCCGLRRHSWLGTDKPERIHRRIHPNCEFLNRKDEFNMPVKFEGTTPNLQKIEALMVRLNEETRIVAHAAESGNDVSEYSVSNPTTTTESSTALKHPKHPEYVLKSQRISSFQGWPDGVPQTPDVMADAGFYFAGFGDCVRCYYCGIGLRHWAEENNPWIEHVRWSQHCAFIKNVKGQEFINLVQMAVQYEQNADENQASGTNEIAEQQAEPQSRQGISSQTILEKVQEQEAEMASLVDNFATMDLNRHDNPSGGGVSVASVDENSASAVKGEISKGTVTNTIEQENKKLKELTMCKKCQQNLPCIVFLPCGHLCCCDSCAPTIRTCPICQKEVKGTVETNMQ